MNNNKNLSIYDDKSLSDRKREAIQDKIVEELRQNPLIQSACQKLNINRSTVYRWIKTNVFFKDRCTSAIMSGNEIINDLAKHQLIKNIKEGHYPSVIYQLSRRHPEYIDSHHDYKISEWWQMLNDEDLFEIFKK